MITTTAAVSAKMKMVTVANNDNCRGINSVKDFNGDSSQQ